MRKGLNRKNTKKTSSRRKEILSSLFNVYNKDAVALLRSIPKNTVNLFLTDIPYEKVNKRSNGIRVLQGLFRGKVLCRYDGEMSMGRGHLLTTAS